jgi:hypothetical protein
MRPASERGGGRWRRHRLRGRREQITPLLAKMHNREVNGRSRRQAQKAGIGPVSQILYVVVARIGHEKGQFLRAGHICRHLPGLRPSRHYPAVVQLDPVGPHLECHRPPVRRLVIQTHPGEERVASATQVIVNPRCRMGAQSLGIWDSVQGDRRPVACSLTPVACVPFDRPQAVEGVRPRQVAEVPGVWGRGAGSAPETRSMMALWGGTLATYPSTIVPRSAWVHRSRTETAPAANPIYCQLTAMSAATSARLRSTTARVPASASGLTQTSRRPASWTRVPWMPARSWSTAITS